MGAMLSAETRTCARCKQLRPIEEFPLRRKSGTDRYYRHSYCPDCRREKRYEWGREHRAELTAGMRERYWADPERYKSAVAQRRRAAGIPERKPFKGHRFRLYGITQPEYDAMLTAQGGRCAICHEEPNGRQLGVDHDHATGRVRGLLCSRCNMGLGAYRDDVALLRQAITYLEA